MYTVFFFYARKQFLRIVYIKQSVRWDYIFLDWTNLQSETTPDVSERVKISGRKVLKKTDEKNTTCIVATPIHFSKRSEHKISRWLLLF